jgi:hypothetical protein
MVHSTDPVTPGTTVGLHFDPDEIHVMAKSDFSPDRGHWMKIRMMGFPARRKQYGNANAKASRSLHDLDGGFLQ